MGKSVLERFHNEEKEAMDKQHLTMKCGGTTYVICTHCGDSEKKTAEAVIIKIISKISQEKNNLAISK